MSQTNSPVELRSAEGGNETANLPESQIANSAAGSEKSQLNGAEIKPEIKPDESQLNGAEIMPEVKPDESPVADSEKVSGESLIRTSETKPEAKPGESQTADSERKSDESLSAPAAVPDQGQVAAPELKFDESQTASSALSPEPNSAETAAPSSEKELAEETNFSTESAEAQGTPDRDQSAVSTASAGEAAENALPKPGENEPEKPAQSPMVSPPPAPPAPPEPPMPPAAPEPEEEEPLTLLGHLGELRHRLTRMVIGVIVGFFACWNFAEPMYALLAEPLRAVLPEGSTLIYTGPASAFFVYMKVALVMAIFGSSPYLFYQIWAFVAPGLYKEEQHAILPVAFFSAFFFLCGAFFCYLLVFPIAFDFFMGFATADIRPMISIDEYLSFALKMLIAFGLVFEMPLFSYFLTKMRLLTPAFMRKNRKYSILVIFIVAAVLTPPDVFSQTLMAIPMLLLYEVSIYVSMVASKKVRPLKSEQGEDPKKSETA